MRGCRNALEAALSERGDAHDLVDAYEYAEKVIEDLTDGIDYFQELVRHLMQTASVHTVARVRGVFGALPARLLEATDR